MMSTSEKQLPEREQLKEKKDPLVDIASTSRKQMLEVKQP